MVIASFFKIFIELVKRHLICGLVLTILFTMFLNCIVGEMHKFIHIFSSVLLTTSPHIPLTVKPKLIVSVKRPHSYVELAAIVQQGVDILLHYECLMLWEGDQRLGNVLNEGLPCLVDCDPIAPVRFLSRFEDVKCILYLKFFKAFPYLSLRVMCFDLLYIALIDMHSLGHHRRFVDFVYLAVSLNVVEKLLFIANLR